LHNNATFSLHESWLEMVRRCFVSYFASLLLASVAFSQCYDLRSTRLYEPQGRYQEWWDKPLWNGESGTENFHIDEPGWGRSLHFALFDLGIVRKTPQGWIPHSASRLMDEWCDPTPERSGVFCYVKPYQTPSPKAKIHIIRNVREHWSVSRDGIVSYRFHDEDEIPVKVENGSDYKFIPNELGLGGTDENDATLDLNTGVYKFEAHGHMAGAFIRRYPGTGVNLWRIDTFHAEAVLHKIPCPASLTDTVLIPEMLANVPSELEMKATPNCIVKMNQTQKNAKGQSRELWEFIQNIDQVSSPEKCIQVFDSRSPSRMDDVPLVKADSH
jgi:hypothetical protein